MQRLQDWNKRNPQRSAHAFPFAPTASALPDRPAALGTTGQPHRAARLSPVTQFRTSAAHANGCSPQNEKISRGWFRSIDLWVMGPARFRCATLLHLWGEIIALETHSW